MLPSHLAPSLVANSVQGFSAGHPLIASMMRFPPPAFSHVPAGAAAGALAGVTPRNTSLRNPAMPPTVKPAGLTSQAHGSGGQSQAHAPVTTSSSCPSSSGTSTSHVATVAVATSMHQPGTEHKAGEMREPRPNLMSDLARRGASPTVQPLAATHPPASVSNKVISIVPSASLPQSHPGQKPSVPTLPPHHPSSVLASGPATGVGASVSSSMSHMPPSAAVGLSGLSQQSKMLPSNTVSVTPALLTTTAKVYTPPHHLAFTAPRQPPISSSDSTMVCASTFFFFCMVFYGTNYIMISMCNKTTCTVVLNTFMSCYFYEAGENCHANTHIHAALSRSYLLFLNDFGLSCASNSST